jgi:hypothetical protein
VETVTKIAIFVLECVFAVGIVGSAIVILLTSVEDFEVFFKRDRAPNGDSAPQQQVSQEP